MIVFLAWIRRVLTCCAYRTGPEQPLDFFECLWRREHRTTEHTQSGVSPLTGLSPQSFTLMPPLLVSTDLMRVMLCFCVCMCAVQDPKFFQAPKCGHTPSAGSTPTRPSCSLVRPQRADMKLDITAGGWQRRLEQLPEPHTPLTSLFSSSPLALSLIMPAQRESTQQHKNGYIGLYPVLHLGLCTFLHHVLMDNLTCPKRKHA